ncbi:class I adenylate-forming enzyme family protein [Conexibacter sp. CPCC 206217]|uniref:class I adenylate-forming enzyme family protein n=1 Tax=Conexibacter sp. CPCC 206217 TaxID=3064574 RepID=UPI00271CE4E0|nr:class I adenylate-forming enzyme family protein [Conexibacter sp. CPCC 206217]MDO8210117.1 class I adenylate-forming enzyme family protein [Conexibacter sp. CPCC 206217]
MPEAVPPQAATNPLGSGAQPPQLTYGDLVHDAATRHGDRTALVLGEERLTFAQLAARVEEAQVRLARAGVVAGDRVGVLGTNSSEWLAAVLATMASGAVAVPLNARDRADGFAHALMASEASHLFHATQVARRDLAGLPAQLAERGWAGRAVALDRERLREAAPGAGPAGGAGDGGGAAPEDLGMILFTSGSTSRPKGCMLTQQGLIRNALLHTARLGITHEDRWFSPMPFFHAGGFVWGVTSMLVTGATLVSQERFEAGAALDLIERERCTYHHGIDAMFVAELTHPAFSPARVASLRVANSTGSVELLGRIHEQMGVEGVVSKWGLSEAYGNLTLSSPKDPLAKRLRTVGRGYEGIEYRIADPSSGGALSTGATGEIQIRGAAMEGYWRDPEATRAMFTADGWLRSGDLGSFDADGFLTYSGRLKEMLKVGGENVAIAEVEDVLMTHPDVQLAVVVGASHTRLDQVPVAFVVPRAGARPTRAGLDGHARERLADFKVPRDYVVVGIGEIPTTGSGKVQRIELTQSAERMLAAGDLSLERA